MHFEYELFTLKNGLQVLLVPSDTTYSTTISASIKSGSALENKENQGITHFIEHMALGETKKWPSKTKLNELIEFNGASRNGETGKEILYYYINIPYNKVDFGIDFISEILYNAKFKAKSIEQERTVILDEISKYQDEAGYLDYRNSRDKLLLTKTAYTFDIAGQPEIVSKISHGQLKKFYKKVHSPNKVFITVAGNFNKQKIKSLILKTFNDIPITDEIREYPTEEIESGLIDVTSNSKTDLIYAGFEMKTKGYKELSSEEAMQRQIIKSCLMIPMSSRLKKRLREKEGILYSIYSTDVIYQKFGITGVGYTIKPEFFVKSVEVIFEEFDKFRKGITKAELMHHKEFLINRNLVNYDEIHSYARLLRGQVFEGKKRISTLKDINETIHKTKLTDVNKIIEEELDLQKINVLAFGNTKPELKDIIKNVVNKYK